MNIPEGFEVVPSSIPEGFEVVQPVKRQEPEAPIEEKSFMQGVSDFFTGNDRATELTDRLPELVEPNGLFYGEDQSTVLKVLPALMTTLDTEGIKNIITSNFENIGVAYNKDAKGGIFPVLRNNKNGAVAQINRAGLSDMDLMQGGTLAAAFTPAGRAGMGSAGTLGAALKVGGASAATQSAMNAQQQYSGRDANALDIASEVGFAGIGGAVFESLFRTVGPVIKGVWNKLREGKIDETSRQLFKEQSVKLGVDPDDVTDDFIRKAANDAAESFESNPEALTALEREFDVTLSNAQRSGNQSALSSEDSLRAGLRGGKAQEVYLQNEAAQMDDLVNASSKLQAEVGNGSELLSNRQQAGDAVREGVRNAERTAAAAKNQAYDSVGDASLEASDFKGVLRQMRKSITGVEFDRTLPETAKILDASKGVIKAIDKLGDSIKPYHIRQIENYRRRLNTAAKSAAPRSADARQIAIMKQQFDDSLDSAVHGGLFKGDEQALDALKNARSLNFEYATQFRNPESKIVQKIVDSNPTDEEVINSLFSASSFNKAGAANLAKSYKKILGADSEAWNMVRQAAYKQLIKTSDEGVISGAKTATAISKAMEQNRSLMKELFGDKEIAKIRRFSALVKRAQPELAKSRENPSGTAQKAIKEAGRFLPALLDSTLITVSGGVWKMAKNRSAVNAANAAFRPFAGVRSTGESMLEGASIGQSEKAASGASSLVSP